MAFQAVTKLSEIPDGDVKGVEVSGKQIALFRLGNDIFALSDVCTHEGCLISENHEILGGDEVECTCHGSHFNVRTGEVTGPPAMEKLEKYDVKVEEGQVLVDV